MAGLINYVRKVFKNYPDTSTPTTAENLNVMDKGIYDLDQALGTALGSTDISGIGDGSIKGAINQLNNDLTNLEYETISTTEPTVTLLKLQKKITIRFRSFNFGTVDGTYRTKITLAPNYRPNSDVFFPVIIIGLSTILKITASSGIVELRAVDGNSHSIGVANLDVTYYL